MRSYHEAGITRVPLTRPRPRRRLFAALLAALAEALLDEPDPVRHVRRCGAMTTEGPRILLCDRWMHRGLHGAWTFPDPRSPIGVREWWR